MPALLIEKSGSPAPRTRQKMIPELLFRHPTNASGARMALFVNVWTNLRAYL
jgi:hypothetical protein